MRKRSLFLIILCLKTRKPRSSVFDDRGSATKVTAQFQERILVSSGVRPATDGEENATNEQDNRPNNGGSYVAPLGVVGVRPGLYGLSVVASGLVTPPVNQQGQ